MPSLTKSRKFNSNSKVVSSPYFALIMEKYDRFGDDMSQSGFHHKYVLPLDPNITYISWLRFANNVSRAVKKKTEILLTKFVDKKASENEMENSSIKNILAISDEIGRAHV